MKSQAGMFVESILRTAKTNKIIASPKLETPQACFSGGFISCAMSIIEFTTQQSTRMNC